MIRLILSGICALLLILISLPILLIQWILKLVKPEKRDRFNLAFIRFCMKAMLFCAGTKTTIIGAENIPKDQPVLYVGNHRSGYDALITMSRMDRPVCFVAKKELRKLPYISYWMELIHVLFLDRENLRQGLQVINQAIEYVNQGMNCYIFPEGTRNKEEDEADLLEFHEASFRVATRTGCLIVPVAINNSVQIFEAHAPKIKRTHVVVEYCQPIDPKALPRDEQRHLGVATRMIIQQALQKNKVILQEELGA